MDFFLEKFSEVILLECWVWAWNNQYGKRVKSENSLELGLNLLETFALRFGQIEKLEDGNEGSAYGKEPVSPVLAHYAVHIRYEIGFSVFYKEYMFQS